MNKNLKQKLICFGLTLAMIAGAIVVPVQKSVALTGDHYTKYSYEEPETFRQIADETSDDEIYSLILEYWNKTTYHKMAIDSECTMKTKPKADYVEAFFNNYESNIVDMGLLPTFSEWVREEGYPRRAIDWYPWVKNFEYYLELLDESANTGIDIDVLHASVKASQAASESESVSIKEYEESSKEAYWESIYAEQASKEAEQESKDAEEASKDAEEASKDAEKASKDEEADRKAQVDEGNFSKEVKNAKNILSKLINDDNYTIKRTLKRKNSMTFNITLDLLSKCLKYSYNEASGLKGKVTTDGISIDTIKYVCSMNETVYIQYRKKGTTEWKSQKIGDIYTHEKNYGEGTILGTKTTKIRKLEQGTVYEVRISIEFTGSNDGWGEGYILANADSFSIETPIKTYSTTGIARSSTNPKKIRLVAGSNSDKTKGITYQIATDKNFTQGVKTYKSHSTSHTFAVTTGRKYYARIVGYKTNGKKYSIAETIESYTSTPTIDKISLKNGKIKVKINGTNYAKSTEGGGFQIKLATSKKNLKVGSKKNVRTYTTSNNTKTLKYYRAKGEDKKLQSRKTYYVKIRAYHYYTNSSGKKIRVYSAWSKIKKIKVK